MKAILITLFTFSLGLFAQNNADDCLGIWLVQEKNAKVEIFKSGNKYFGKIIWLKEPLDAQGKPKTDTKNPDPKKRSTPILNMQFMYNFVFNADDAKWENGSIYDANGGKTYSAQYTMSSKDVLDLRGYIGVSWLGRTSTWTRSK